MNPKTFHQRKTPEGLIASLRKYKLLFQIIRQLGTQNKAMNVDHSIFGKRERERERERER